jgi:hypothetical protein
MRTPTARSMVTRTRTGAEGSLRLAASVVGADDRAGSRRSAAGDSSVGFSSWLRRSWAKGNDTVADTL